MATQKKQTSKYKTRYGVTASLELDKETRQKLARELGLRGVSKVPEAITIVRADHRRLGLSSQDAAALRWMIVDA